ncbi:MAG: MmcQ/YjbR family DNA-binding protein [Bacteroidaceae bacterium]
MNIEEARDYCLAQKRAEECMPFDENTIVVKVMGRMFMLMSLERGSCITLKCEPSRAVELRERYKGIEPAWHFNKKYWNQIWLDRDVSDDLVKELIDHSLCEVLKRFSKKKQQEYADSI